MSQREAAELQACVQRFVRTFGLLVTKQTPCGQPVSPSYAHALMLLLQRGARGLATTQSDLAAELGLDKSSVTRLSALLESDGRITQQRAPEDGRSRILQLTGRGKKLATTIQTASIERFARVLDAIAPDRRGEVLDSLAVLTKAVASLGVESR